VIEHEALQRIAGVAVEIRKRADDRHRFEVGGGGHGFLPEVNGLARRDLGERDTALGWLDRAAREKDPWLYAMSINAPIFDAIRPDPRFAEAATTMKLDPSVMAKPSKET